MARYSEHDTAAIYEVAERFRDECLRSDGSLIFQGEAIWTRANLERLHEVFVGSPDESKRSFLDKFRDQLQPTGEAVTRLGAEVVAIYFLFPSSVSGARKREVVGEILSWVGDTLPEDDRVSEAFSRGVGSGGQGYNTRRPNELWFLIDFALAWKQPEQQGIPVEWVPISSGARISFESGTENLDWTAGVLRRIVEFTQAGGVINIIVDGTCVGAQSYWNAEATMIEHCRGALIMTPSGSMLLTGKRALEYSGSVSAPTNLGIGGLEEVMWPNGQAQYRASNLREAYTLLFRHYELTYRSPGGRFVVAGHSSDPVDRDVTRAAYRGSEGFASIGEIFSDETNGGRKRPFAIREVMEAVVDQGTTSLERWAGWEGASTAVVYHAELGGQPVCLIGIESKSGRRKGQLPPDGPDCWTSGTLFPESSRKVSRAISAVSGMVPVVVLANLSGFDGSPESLKRWQLEYGARIGRAVVNFDGPIVFAVIGRYHGGAYVVFSQALNDGLVAGALEGTYASVIGGGPAAAVVFPGLVRRRTAADERVAAARKELDEAKDDDAPAARARHDAVYRAVEAEKQVEVANEFDNVHTVRRAQEVGSLSAIVPPTHLRPWLIEQVKAGLKKSRKQPRR